MTGQSFSQPYRGEHLSRIAFPLGGIGAGMICVDGNGSFSHVSVRNKPEMYHEPLMFAAVKVVESSKPARILAGPVPPWRIFGPPGTGNGAKGRNYGLPHFAEAEFESTFPFAKISFHDPSVPLKCRLQAWSPFLPGNADDSSLPVAVLEYEFENPAPETVESVFSFHAENFLAAVPDSGSVDRGAHGFILRNRGNEEQSWQEGAFSVSLPDEDPRVDCAWFRGDWFDATMMLWKNLDQGRPLEQPPHPDSPAGSGGSLYKSFTLAPGESRRIKVLLTWHVAKSDQRTGDNPEDKDCALPTHVPWYAETFPTVESVTDYFLSHFRQLKDESARFRDCFYASTLPPELLETVAANLTILKSPTLLRQPDGRIWGWEGCQDHRGCCDGSCTHVWNYAQSIPHLFPDLERSLRKTEFGETMNTEGHQRFRAPLPIRDAEDHRFHAAADGQLGGIMKLYRDWRICGDTRFLCENWSAAQTSLDYCIRTWDPEEEGVLREPHHNTYDIEFWGPNGMCTSFYLGALKAAFLMAESLKEDGSRYRELYRKGRRCMETELFDGEYFIQQIQWTGLRAGNPQENEDWNCMYSPEARAMLELEGPKYQYGTGCLSDGVLGAWMAMVCGLGEILDPEKVRSHLRSVYKYNFRRNLRDHANPQRPGYALGQEGGLLLCTWPKGGKLSLPFIYSNEVWTGIEYQVASHLMWTGQVEEGLEIVRTARARYDGRIRNPYDEYECGHWYARAMSSFALLQGMCGIRYDAIDKVLEIHPRIMGDFQAFFSTESGYGTAGVRNGTPFCDCKYGIIPFSRIDYQPCRTFEKDK